MNSELLTRASIEWLQNDGVLAVDTEIELNTAGFAPEDFDEYMTHVERQAQKDTV
jgi:hypothetical protein